MFSQNPCILLFKVKPTFIFIRLKVLDTFINWREFRNYYG